MYLDQAVIKLHDIARLVEQQLGKGNLSEDLRSCADRLQECLNPVKNTGDNYDPVI